MIFEYTLQHSHLNFSGYAYRSKDLFSGSIVYGVLGDDDYPFLQSSIPITGYTEQQYSGSIPLLGTGLVVGKNYKTFFNLATSSSGSYYNDGIHKAWLTRPLISTTISGSKDDFPTLNEVAWQGNTTTKDITANNLIATNNMFCNISGTGTASITFDSIIGDQLTNDGINFAMDNFLVIPVSGSTFETALIYNDAQVGGNLEVDGNIISNGLLSTSSSTIYTQVLGPNSDQFHYFYHGNAVGAYMYWDSSEELFAFNKPVKKITTRVTTTYTILIGDEVIYCDTDGGAFTVTLPAGSDGQTFRIINCGTSNNDLTVAPNGAELLTGVNASKTAGDGTVIILTYETTEGWY